jgi:hypothetical protein
MTKTQRLNFGKLLGFEVVDQVHGEINFKDETMGARLGAKVGLEPGTAPEIKLAFDKLLGFDAVSEKFMKGLDFQDPTVGAKLGAKVGEPDA